MFSRVRAAGYAAVAISMAASAAFTAPSFALDVNEAPITSTYIDHAAANLDGSDLASNPQGEATLAHDVDFSTPVATHAVAAAIPSSIQPGEADTRSLRDLVAAYAETDTDNAEQECLASAVYFESKGEPLEGQLAVAEVIINRKESGRFAGTLCGVVKQRGQFSFVRGGRIPSVPKASEAWRKAVAIAQIAQEDMADSAGSSALFFHADYVRPNWRGLTRVAAVGNHIFYR